MIDSTFDAGRSTAAPAETQLQISESDVRQRASRAASTWQALRRPRDPESWKSDWARTQGMVVQLLTGLEEGISGQPKLETSQKVTEAGVWLKENPGLLRGALAEISGSERELNRLPCVRAGAREHPRVVAISRDLVGALHDHWSEPGLSAYVEEFQKRQPLALHELFLFPPAL